MNVNVIYEETLQIPVDKAFELSIQWVSSQHKAKIKKSNLPTFIETKQGTMNTNTGHDPNWKKRIRINIYDLENGKSLIRVEATPLSRTIFRVDKLKESWYNGLFSSLFSLLERMTIVIPPKTLPKQKIEALHCHNCGNKIDKEAKICPNCGIDVV
ncbi:MAG: zinc ribbon domain-containing protein [Candidatus Lokiarchaeota archaeon]|nr:zinc ribbon domain-containing protein [Candidatus Lokiarchaeota archaeon]